MSDFPHNSHHETPNHKEKLKQENEGGSGLSEN